MYKKSICFVAALLFLSQSMVAQTPRPEIDMSWWKEAKFGMFLHWGLYSLTAGEWKGKGPYNEFIQVYAQIPVSEMVEFAKGFNPEKFDADRWVSAAKDAGMKYLVITSKHHEGFAMFRSADPYNIVDGTPFGRDPLRELSEACARHGLKFCVYYSLGRDWADPDVPSNWPRMGGRSNDWDFPNEREKEFATYFERKVKPQMKELLTQYGPLGVVWFDTHGFCTKAQSQELIDMIQTLQPGCIINDRVGNGLGDFHTPEQTVSGDIDRTPWESCITMGNSWGFSKYDKLYKPSEVMIRLLVDIASKGGNLLLNVPPTPEGEFTPQAYDRLADIGRWMKVNGEAIYGTTAWRVNGESFVPEKIIAVTDASAPDASKDETAKGTEPDIRFTTKGNTLYVVARSWKAPQVTVQDLLLTPDESIKRVSLLGYEGPINYTTTPTGITMDLPAAYRPKTPVYVYKIEL